MPRHRSLREMRLNKLERFRALNVLRVIIRKCLQRPTQIVLQIGLCHSYIACSTLQQKLYMTVKDPDKIVSNGTL